jgi:hypothetical protein
MDEKYKKEIDKYMEYEMQKDQISPRVMKMINELKEKNLIQTIKN